MSPTFDLRCGDCCLLLFDQVKANSRERSEKISTAHLEENIPRFPQLYLRKADVCSYFGGIDVFK